MMNYEAFYVTAEEPEEELADETEDATGISLSITIKIGESTEDLDLDGMCLDELEVLMEQLQQKLDELQDTAPEDESSDEYGEWEDTVDDLEDQISQVEDAIEELGKD